MYCFDETFYYINGNFSLCNDEYKESFPEKEYVLVSLYQQVIQWLLIKLDFHYPMLRFEIFDDNSGCWCQEIPIKIEINFNNLEEGITKAIELLENSTNRASTTEM